MEKKNTIDDCNVAHQKLKCLLRNANVMTVNVTTECYVETPLHLLCKHYKKDNLIDLVALFIQNGADVNAENENGQTPLHLLCKHYKNDNLIDLVKILIEKGADVNAKR